MARGQRMKWGVGEGRPSREARTGASQAIGRISVLPGHRAMALKLSASELQN